MSDLEEASAGSSGVGRRDFVKAAAAVAATLLGKTGLIADEAGKDGNETVASSSGKIPTKLLGKTGVKVSAMGLGGFHLGTAKDQDTVNTIVGRAIDAGVTFFDNAWEYHKGDSEVRVGKALQGKRDQVLVMTKVCTHGRGKDVAMKMLEDLELVEGEMIPDEADEGGDFAGDDGDEDVFGLFAEDGGDDAGDAAEFDVDAADFDFAGDAGDADGGCAVGGDGEFD